MYKTDPTWNSKILGVKFAKNFKILKIAGPRAEFLDFELKLKTFFENSTYFLFGDKIQNSAKITTLFRIYVFTKIIFIEVGKKPVGQCWFGARPLIFSILPHKYP